MLKREDNERLTRVGPDTPGGEMLRRYWTPALLSMELPEPDGAPVRVRLLGEDLIAFRDTSGEVGLVDAYCPHRRAPLFFGRNEESGLRCVYHGWKFDRKGDCVDMPSDPPGSALKNRVKLRAYPTVDRGGVIWTYMGPPELMPPPPDYEWLRAPATHRFVSKTHQDCNYLQGLEGGLDTAHSSFVHNEDIHNPNLLRSRDTAPQLDVTETDYGYQYVSTRKTGPSERYIRIYQYIMPAQQMRGHLVDVDGTPAKMPNAHGHLWVPIDDEHTWVYNWMYSLDSSKPLSEEYALEHERFAGRGPDDLIPGTYRLKSNLSNDYFIDRQLQKTRTYTGIKGVNTQDFALQEGMGPIVDRSKEHLGSSDRAIVQMRRLLLEAVRTVENGRQPRGCDPSTTRDVRAYDKVITADVDWKSALTKELQAVW